MKLIIDIDSEDYDFLKDSHLSYNMDSLSKQSNKDVEGTLTLLRLVDNVKNGISFKELDENPCLTCGNNCCNHKECEYHNLIILKENKQ